MEQLHEYSPESIIRNNLDESAARHSGIFEQELAHLAELAREWVENQADEAETVSALAELRLQESTVSPIGVPTQNQNILQRLNRIHTASKRLLLSDEIRKLLSLGAHELPTDFFLEAEKQIAYSEHRIVYQKNNFSDLAFLQFAPLLDAPRASYAHSFSSACEDVYNGICEYCILPLENSSEGRLIGFEKLIDSYGLKITATADIVENETSRVTRFALLRRNLLPLLPSADIKQSYLEISFPMTNDPSTAELLLAAQLCGLTLYRIHSLPEAESTYRYHVIFSIGNGALSTFLLYMAMEIPQYTPIGIYTHILQKRK